MEERYMEARSTSRESDVGEGISMGRRPFKAAISVFPFFGDGASRRTAGDGVCQHGRKPRGTFHSNAIPPPPPICPRLPALALPLPSPHVRLFHLQG
ncbi:hypothetical protein HPP92_016918 [Vanilla planifolia]|uniref:Uncharacterized protein n=1 Tax=Vanilla planifolia TaxID=51239 RepID=A0A835QEZ6_VANPL|nr:hypothetical protein HPP92_016918 [Vanilla planifolia]